MFVDSFPKLTLDEIKSVEWQDDPELYDSELAALCSKYKRCIVINPDLENPNWVYFIDHIPENKEECIVYYYKDQWLAKLFYRGWTPEAGYKQVVIKTAQTLWRKNPDLDNSMTFFDTPFGKYEPEPWDQEYTLVWYMDKEFNPTEDEIWVMTCECVGIKSKGIKHMGYLTPEVKVEFNESVAPLPINLDGCMPPYWDLVYDCVYQLDTAFTQSQEDPVWFIKISPAYRQTKDWKILGTITPEPEIIYNTNLGVIDYDIDLSEIDYSDFEYELIFMLDRDFIAESADDIWALKIRYVPEPIGAKVLGTVVPNINLEKNPDIDKVIFDEDELHNLPFLADDFNKVQTFYVQMDYTKNHKIWAYRKSVSSTASEEVDMGYIAPIMSSTFDVFYISYDELNAEENFLHLKSICPNVKRIQGVKGILESHKAAAKKAKTTMFWVVDGDAWVDDNFKFDFQPGIFDLDCVHVWHSKNPFNKLTYGYGGVKLFPTNLLKDIKVWGNDLTTSVGKKLKVITEVSNETRFNTSPFYTWRSTFRESVKLGLKEDSESQKRLKSWADIDFKQPHAEWAARAVIDAETFVRSGNDSSLVNDYEYLKTFFIKQYPNVRI